MMNLTNCDPMVWKDREAHEALATGAAIGAAVMSVPQAEALALIQPAAQLAATLFSAALPPKELRELALAVISALDRLGL